MYIVQTDKGHCWAHISSKDLVHWRHHPLALEPGEGDTGIFSGGASLDKNGVPTITYWGLGAPRGVCIATSTDDLLEVWTKSPHNPVIRETQHGLAEVELNGKSLVYGAADPSAIWIHGERYYMITGNPLVLREFGLKRGELEHQGDTAYLFVSDDLATWEYLHPFYTSNRQWTRADEDNMCPDFFPLPSNPDGGSASDRHMLLFISHNLGCQYYIGTYSGDRFKPEMHGRMTWVDNAFFAPESLVDDRGRRIMWAWIFDGRSLEIIQARQFGVKICCSAGGEEETLVFYDAVDKALKIDTRHASLGEGPKTVESAPLELADDEPLVLRVFIDRSVVEVFANDRQAAMRRIYPTRDDARGALLFARGSGMTISSLRAWDQSLVKATRLSAPNAG